MKHLKKFLIIIMILTICVSLMMTFVACDKNKNNSNKGNNGVDDSTTLTDISGEPINISGKVDRIACIGTGVLRMISYAGVQDKIVCIEGTDKFGHTAIKKGQQTTVNEKQLIKKPYAYVNRELFKDIGVCSEGGGPNPPVDVETLITFNPQVVFCSYIDQDMLDKLRSDLKQFNITLVKIFIDTDIYHTQARENIRKSFNIIGKVCDAEERCNEIIKKIDDTFADLDNRTKNIENRPSVYVGAMSYRGAHGIDWTYSKFSCLQAINTPGIMDGKNPDLTQGPSGAFQCGLEDFKDCDYMFLDITNEKQIKETLKGKKEIISAFESVKNDRVHSMISYNFYSTNIEYALAISYYMGKVLYPEQFSDVVIKDKINELTTFFDGVALYDDMVHYGLEFKTIDLASLATLA